MAGVSGIAQAFTSFDHPGYHRLAWSEILGESSPVVIHSPQVYASLGTDATLASRASMRARVARVTSQWAAEVRRGVAPRYAPGGAAYRPYLQLHGVSLAATVGYAVEQAGVCLWAAPSRIDRDGERAVRALSALDLAGFWGAGAVERYQASKGLTAVGIVGAGTLAALGV